jgi:hypothetical protein
LSLFIRSLSLSEVFDALNSSELVSVPDHIDGDEMPIEGELKEEDNGESGKSISFFVFSAILVAFFIWLLIGLWGFLQEMSYGHG